MVTKRVIAATINGVRITITTFRTASRSTRQVSLPARLAARPWVPEERAGSPERVVVAGDFNIAPGPRRPRSRLWAGQVLCTDMSAWAALADLGLADSSLVDQP
jgi:exonuclease III